MEDNYVSVNRTQDVLSFDFYHQTLFGSTNKLADKLDDIALPFPVAIFNSNWLQIRLIFLFLKEVKASRAHPKEQG